jgi:hypothetical protein
MSEHSEETDNYADRALSEACLRLAYYVSRHGPIPDADQRQLFALATFGRGTEEFLAIGSLARDIRGYLLELSRGDRQR